MGQTLNFQDFFSPENNQYFLISTNEAGYKIAWSLNKNLQMHFCRAADHELTIKNTTHYFELFEYEDSSEQIWKLVKTKSIKGAPIAIREISVFDFIIILQNPLDKKNKIDFIRKIKSISMIRLIQELRFERFSGKTVYNLPI